MTGRNLPDSQAAAFGIELLRYLDQKGVASRTLPDFARNSEELVGLYRAMVLTRTFDEKAVALQRTGRLGTYASCLGQEAVGVGTASAMAPDDVFLPTFREHAAQLWRGVTLLELFQYWGGDERGSDFAVPKRDFPVCIPVASHLPHAAGVALAMKLRKESRAAVAICGDGATSKGDFYESINVAGVWKLPLVVVINNNQWAISVPRSAQTAAETLAQKAVAAGIEGLQVDGNDVVAVRQAVGDALNKARAGDGATLIEALSYRMGDHTTADDASRYRDDAEVGRHWKADPLARLRTYLGEQANWTKENEEDLLKDSSQIVSDAADAYLALAPEPSDAMFDYLFETLPADVERQKRERRTGGFDG